MTGKDLRWIPLFNKVVDLRPATLLKKRLRHRCFSVNLVKFLRRPFSQNIPRSVFDHFVGLALKGLETGIMMLL